MKHIFFKIIITCSLTTLIFLDIHIHSFQSRVWKIWPTLFFRISLRKEGKLIRNKLVTIKTLLCIKKLSGLHEILFIKSWSITNFEQEKLTIFQPTFVIKYFFFVQIVLFHSIETTFLLEKCHINFLPAWQRENNLVGKPS